MVKIFNVKHAKWGACALFCLIGTAHANVVFDKVPTYGNIPCEGEKRFETFVLLNTGGNIGIEDIEIEIEAGDSFAHDKDLVKIVHEHDAQEGDDIEHCVIGQNWQLVKGEKCKIVTEVNPKTLECPSTGTLTGHIHRSLEIDLNGSQKDMYSPIEFKVNRIGSADGFALLGEKITNHHAGTANVYQNIACTDDKDTDSEHPHCIDLDNIQLNDGAKAYGPHDKITHLAVADMKAAYKTAQELKKDRKCTYLDSDLGGHHQIITSGTYCFKHPAPVVVKGDMRISGTGDVVFIIDYPHTYSSDNSLFVNPNVEFILEDGAKTKHVYWFVKGSVETNQNSKFPGTIIATGNFESEDYGTGTLIDGRILLLPDEHASADEPYDGEIALHGNTIINPDSHH